uniref:Uncharacterized protein n=1 Tax=Cacopsylla melanoneura TaxID=428564 RepID=A0A8D9AI68_9HEMI
MIIFRDMTSCTLFFFSIIFYHDIYSCKLRKKAETKRSLAFQNQVQNQVPKGENQNRNFFDKNKAQYDSRKAQRLGGPYNIFFGGLYTSLFLFLNGHFMTF